MRNNKACSFINENKDGILVVIRYIMEWQQVGCPAKSRLIIFSPDSSSIATTFLF
jgi:hypothetical protein